MTVTHSVLWIDLGGGSGRHCYEARRDARLRGAVYDLPEITGDQSRAARKALVRWELDRAQRIEARDIPVTPERMGGSI